MMLRASIVTGITLIASVLLSGPGLVLAQGRDRTPPTAPTNLRVTGVTPYTVSLAWNPSTDNSGKFSYTICCANVSSQIVPQTATSVVYTAGLEAARTFTLRIYARDAAGNYSQPSNSVTFTLPADTTPPARPQVSVTGVGVTHASLAWSAAENGPHVWYSVFVNGARRIHFTRETSGTIFLLEPQTTYTFTVLARDFAGLQSPLSDPVAATTAPVNPNDHEPPSVPAGLTEDHNDDLEIELRWQPSVDDFDPEALIRYDVFVNGVLSDIRVGVEHSQIYGEPGTNTVEVVAVDTAGNRSAAATVTIVF
jgi:chitodextrinase